MPIGWRQSSGIYDIHKLHLKYDRFHVNVQKSISHHKHESYVAVTETGLTRMIVMKIRYFHVSPIQMSSTWLAVTTKVIQP